jgi:hypothetical protein
MLACSGPQRSTDDTPHKRAPTKEGEKAPLEVFESTFQPSRYDEDVEAIEQRLGERGVQPDEQRDSVKVEEEVLPGFRIQIFASPRIDEATLAKQTAAQLITTDSLYIVFDPPVYKVRVGDYPTRLEANRALASIMQKGYPDAWIVTDRIIQRKYIPIRRDEY